MPQERHNSFKDLLVWQKSMLFAVNIYKAFGKIQDFSFRDQIQRAALSVSNNIAEGYARRSDRALKNYLSIAKGSAVEVESMLIVAEKLGYIQQAELIKLAEQSVEIQKLISRLAKRL